MARAAVFLDGPIGAGKTTLGRELARALSCRLIDGDDFSDPDSPWYCSILRTSRAIVENGLGALDHRPVVVIAYPVNRIGWIFFRRRFEQAGVRAVLIGLHAGYESIVSEQRGRHFSPAERARIATMVAEGYGRRPFSDLTVETGAGTFAETVAVLVFLTRRLLEEG